METIASRNQSSHTYNDATARQMIDRIVTTYAGLFEAFEARMRALADSAG
jgi:hypothetical protein